MPTDPVAQKRFIFAKGMPDGWNKANEFTNSLKIPITMVDMVCRTWSVQGACRRLGCNLHLAFSE
jgi:hypothetical protein